MKKVEYRGKHYEVPAIAKFLATDPDGKIFWFSMKPHNGNIFDEWFPNYNDDQFTEDANIVELGQICSDWENSLVEISEIVKPDFEIINSPTFTKIVEYFGNQYQVPHKATHMATDENGDIHWYMLFNDFDVYCDDEEWLFDPHAPGQTTCDKVDEIEYRGDWKQSLKRI